MIVDSGKYFLYRHIRLDKNEPFYIGVGTKKKLAKSNKYLYNRAFSKERNFLWKNIVNLNPNYEVEILLESDDYEFIFEKEKEFIKLYGRKNNNSGILTNLTDGGEGAVGTIYSNELRNKLSKLRKENVKNIKFAKPWKGCFGKSSPASKPIIQYDKNMNKIKEWNSATEAEKEIGCKRTNICNCLKNRAPSSCGYIWKYKNI